MTGLLLFFRLIVGELQHQLTSILRTLCIQTVIATLPRTLNERLGRLGITQQKLLNVGLHIFIVRLRKEGTIHIVNMLHYRLYADAIVACFRKNLQYLLVVIHVKFDFSFQLIKKAGMLLQPTSPFMLL